MKRLVKVEKSVLVGKMIRIFMRALELFLSHCFSDSENSFSILYRLIRVLARRFLESLRIFSSSIEGTFRDANSSDNFFSKSGVNYPPINWWACR